MICIEIRLAKDDCKQSTLVYFYLIYRNLMSVESAYRSLLRFDDDEAATMEDVVPTPSPPPPPRMMNRNLFSSRRLHGKLNLARISCGKFFSPPAGTFHPTLPHSIFSVSAERVIVRHPSVGYLRRGRLLNPNIRTAF